MKPIKRGIKVWVLGDSTGKKDSRQVGLGEHVVRTLTSELKGLKGKEPPCLLRQLLYQCQTA